MTDNCVFVLMERNKLNVLTLADEINFDFCIKIWDAENVQG